MKKVLVLTTTYPLNDQDTQPRFIESLCKKMSESHQITVLTPSIFGEHGQPASTPNLKIIRYRYFFAKFERLCGGDGILENLKQTRRLFLLIPFMLVAQFFHTLRICRACQIDVIHAHWILPQGIIAIMASFFLGRKVKVLVTSHGGDLYALNGKIPLWLKKFVLKGADHITVVSQAMKSFCLAQLNVTEPKISVAPMGVDLKNTFIPSGEKIKNKLVFVGRLAEKKGVDVLIKAMAYLKDQNLQFSLEIVGGGSKQDYYQFMANEMGLDQYICFHGAVENKHVVKFLQCATVAIFPFKIAEDGDQEGLGLTMVEALGCGCITIASDLPAVRDVIEDGENGVLVEPDNPEKLAQKALYVCTEQFNKKKLMSNGRQSVIDKFDWEIVGINYSRIVEFL